MISDEELLSALEVTREQAEGLRIFGQLAIEYTPLQLAACCCKLHKDVQCGRHEIQALHKQMFDDMLALVRLTRHQAQRISDEQNEETKANGILASADTGR